MTKYELLRYVNALPDGADILFFNGFVNDWQELTLSELPYRMYKQKLQSMYKCMNFETLRDKNELTLKDKKANYKIAKKHYHKQEWQIDDNFKLNPSRYIYTIKYLLTSVSRGISTFDRHGELNY